MAKTHRMIEENLKLTDVLVEITDARIPESGRNPVLSQLMENTKAKPRILLLNKRDYADENATRLWLEYYAAHRLTAISCDCRSGAGLKGLIPLLKKVAGEKKYSGAIRVMAAGIPNSGKSSFINRMAGGKKAAVGDRPGITRGKQWVKVGGSVPVEILDLPGILPPKIEAHRAALNLAYTGAVKDEIMDVHALAGSLALFLAEHHADKLIERYKLDSDMVKNAVLSAAGNDIIENIARARGMMIAGGEPNAERAALALLDEFRSGKIGKITLERPPV
ncbi:MAG: ribosome biogenesis GTPase YlqF [Oscillospiraceae bacterium]|nr:ribosome biogenesis GTPase YlqF [Oscillospiraceae bacterium]